MKKEFLSHLWFSLKDNSKWIYFKKYHDNSIIEVDFENQTIHFGWKIKIYDKEFQKITKPEDLVVFECVNRLLEKWYKSEDILLEKVYPTWRWTSGRLDILVKKDDKAFLMIECKTWGWEFEKELKNMQRNWWQLFTYFQQDRDSEFLILYTSNFNWKEIEYKNEIVKIEESYRETSNVQDLYIRWNKFTKQNGIFENWVLSYNFESKALTRKDLIKIKQEDSSNIFNRFLEILRHNTVSDKPNAFNKIFTLFLCKIYDEWNKSPDDELDFQYKEWVDTDVSFQVRLTDLYRWWMMEFLKKEITDFNDDEFNKEFWEIDPSIRIKILEKITKLRLQKNNEFAIKEVFDEETFIDNAKVLKEVVELLQVYQIRYAEKQPFLWDFFELLLTTWLKQESGQFFTPVPIARFICKSIPIKEIIENKLKIWDTTDLLPSTIDYAAWSGHFLTESMEEVQNIINKIDWNSLKPNVSREIKKWQSSTFDWALEYMYWIEKDYRLVKTAKVGCYLHGDWIATVIHWDWLDSFELSKHYRLKLKEFNSEDKQENAKFDLVLSNPPYSVSAFKWNLDREKSEKDFNLYNELSDKSSEIECLFIERTKQLLKEWWIAAIILPSSILNNTWIYTKAREIILKNFEIISIVSFGSGTFMATGTNTVTLFMRKRHKFFAKNLEASINKFFIDLVDKSFNQIENPFSKYINYVWWVSFEDYKTLLQKAPNEVIKKHELYLEYTKKKKINEILEIEKDKILYFIISYNSDLVLVKSWEKQEEKEFLGYEFSSRKWSEWIHPIQWWKLIDDCTKLFDPKSLDNESKVSTYIYDWFNNKFDREISKDLEKHVSRTKLVDLLTFDRLEFEKTISTNIKKKIEIISKYEKVNLWKIINILYWTRIVKKSGSWTIYPVYWWWWETFKTDSSNRENCYIISRFWMSKDCVRFIEWEFFLNDSWITIEPKDNKIILKWFIDLFLFLNQEIVYLCGRWVWQKNIEIDAFNSLKIPLPPLDIQQKIVNEIEILEKEEKEKKEEVESLKKEIDDIIWSVAWEKQVKIWEIKDELFAWWDLPEWNYIKWLKETEEYKIPIYSNWLEKDWLYWFTNKARVEKPCITISARWTIWFPIERKTFFYPIVRLLVLIPKENIAINKYLVYVIKKLDLKQFWATTPQLTVPQFSDFKIPLPTLETQKQIVSQIEKIESEIEVLEIDLKQIPEKKKEVLKKYL